MHKLTSQFARDARVLKCTALMLCAVIPGCLTSPTILLKPDDVNTKDVTRIQAYIDINRTSPLPVIWQPEPALQFVATSGKSRNIVISDIQNIVAFQDGDKVEAELRTNKVILQLKFDNNDNAVTFSKAVYRLSHGESAANALTAFKAVAKQCEIDTGTPVLRIGDQKLAVQAADAVSRKDYWQAIEILQQVVRTTPCWPDGYYNSALLLADQDDYEDAIDQMSRYLILVPDSPDAQKAQKQIWIWQGREPAPPRAGQQ